MNISVADGVWNRAALESGGASPRPGDRALASLLHLHSLAMNGGIHHAIECLELGDVMAAADGYEYFGLADVAAFLRGAADDPVLCTWTEDTEDVANRRYAEMVPDDEHLVARFQKVYWERFDQFAPLDHA